MSKLRWLLGLMLAVAVHAVGAQAQTRGTISGQVLDETTSQPLSNVQIFVQGTTLGTLSNAEGRFLIVNVPPGAQEVRANRLGYGSGSQRVTVGAGETATVSFRLSPTAVALDEIVVTGTAGAVQRRAQPAVVSTVNAATVVEQGTVTSVTDLLTARVPGVQVTASSGSSGTAQQIRIRGASSISLSNEPLVFIDGVRADARAQNNISTGGQATSRIFDINPEDIETIEVVKGPAAATLYGADASAGVIQIITKKGRPGSNRFSQNISLEYNDIDANFTPLSNFGSCSAANVAAGSGRVLCEGQPVGTVVSDNPLTRTGAFRNGTLQSLGYSARGGGENYGYYVSLGYDQEEGTLPNNEFGRRTARVNFNFTPTSKVSFDAGVGFYRVQNNLPQNDNNVYGFLGGGYLGNPTSVQRNASGGTFGGFYDPRRGVEAISSITSEILTTRFTPTLQANYTPFSWFTNRLIVGGDFSRGEGTQFFPKNDQGWYQGDINTGDLEEDRINFDAYTLDYLGSIRGNLRENISSNLSIGTQLIVERLDRVQGDGTGFVTNANRVVGAASQISASQDFQDTRSLGLLAQWDVGFNERLFLQLGARLDQNSAFGAAAEPFFLPKVGVSYVISDEPYFEGLSTLIPTLRLRAAYGTTGRSPSAGAALETYQAQPFAIVGTGGSSAGVVPRNPGNQNLRPEKGAEFEAGFDAGFLSDRFGLEVTYFNKRTTDLLLRRPVAPSSGFSGFNIAGGEFNPFVNIGEVLNEGLEYALRGTLVQTPNFTWDARISGSTLNNELVSLGEVQPFGTTSIRFQEGRQVGSWVTRTIRSVDTQNNRVVVSDTSEFLGNVLPTNEGTFGTNVTLAQIVRLSGQLDWKTGFRLYNNTAQFRDRVFRNSEVGLRCTEVLTQDECLRRFGPFVSESGQTVAYTQVNEEYIEEGDFLRLREIAATVTLPESFARRLRATSASFTIGGRNLGLWSNYSGEDPEVLSSATTATTEAGRFAREDFLTVPQPRRLVFKMNLGF